MKYLRPAIIALLALTAFGLTSGSSVGARSTVSSSIGLAQGRIRAIVQFRLPPPADTPPSRSRANRLALAEERSGLLQDVPSLRDQPAPFEHDYRRIFNGVATEISISEVAHVRSLPYVKEVFEDTPVKVTLNDSIPLIGADQVWGQVGATGTSVRIAVIDTGVDYTHPDLGGCLGPGCKVVGGYDFSNGDPDPMDDHGHGTHVAGIAAADGAVKGVAPGAQVLAYKSLNAGGFGSSSDIIAALEAAVDPDGNPATDDGADVINLSLGGFGDPDDPLSQAVDNAVDAGAVVVAAAGNSGPDGRTVASPGTARKAITVGATDKNDAVASFSSRGPVVWPNGALIKPDVVAPGVSICSSRWDSAWAGQECVDQEHVTLSGTSMATPHVAGAAALLLDAHPDWTPEEVKMALRSTALDVGYDINTQGYGRLRALPAALLPHAPPVASIATSGTISATTDVYGTASSDFFQSYAFSFGEGTDPSVWTPLVESTAPVSDGVLFAGLDPLSLPEGLLTLRLVVTDSDGLSSEDRTLIEINNVEITAPLNSDVLRKGDLIEIQGSIVGGVAFQGYAIEYGYGHDPAQWFTAGVTLANGGTVPVTDGLLGTWDTGAAGDGDYYTIRLTVDNGSSQSTEYVRDVYLDPALKQGWPQRIPWDPQTQPFALAPPAAVYSSPGGGDAASLTTSLAGDPGHAAQDTGGSYYWAGYLTPVTSDLDRDGGQEIIVYKGGEPPEIRVYRQDGSLYWTAPLGTTGVPGGNLHIPLVADINGDGYDEVIAYRIPPGLFGPSKLYAFARDGAPLPGWPVQVPQDYRPTLAAADLDLDGDQEVVIKGNWAPNRVMVVVGGDGQILSQWSLPEKTWEGPIESYPAVGNLDADPEPEIVAADPSEFAGYDWDTGEWNNTGVVHVYNVDGTELSGWPVYTEGIVFSSPALGDVDEDGQSEIVVGLVFEGEAPDPRYGGLYALDSAGNVLPGWPFEKGWNFWSSPALGDIDGDGDLEVAASRLGAATYVVHQDGTLAAGWPQSTAWNDYHSPILGDVDGDDVPDVLTTAGGVYAWRYDGSAIAGFPKTHVRTQAPATIADIDLDGLIEIAASSHDDTDLETGQDKHRGSLYVWDIAAPFGPSTMEWPHFHHDTQHTGTYCSPNDLDCDSVMNSADNCPTIRNTGQANADGDPFGDACDNCPSAATFWFVPAGDGDCDGWTSDDEGFIGTDPVDACPDDAQDDAWPADINNSTRVDIIDALFFAPVIMSNPGDGRYDSRYNLDAQGGINIIDLLMLGSAITRKCTGP